MENEIWMDVYGYEGRYKISSFGRFMSLYYWDYRVRRLWKVSEKRNYNLITLTKEQQNKTYRVARLVLLHFKPIDNPDDYQANHINGIKSDDRLCNLEWTTCRENILHAWKNWLSKHRRWKDNTQSRKVIVKSITWDFIQNFDSIWDASRYFGVIKTSLSKCVRWEHKTFIPEKWKRFTINYI